MVDAINRYGTEIKKRNKLGKKTKKTNQNKHLSEKNGKKQWKNRGNTRRRKQMVNSKHENLEHRRAGETYYDLKANWIGQE